MRMQVANCRTTGSGQARLDHLDDDRQVIIDRPHMRHIAVDPLLKGYQLPTFFILETLGV